MKYCRNCGKEIDENAVICTGCGVLVNEKVKNTLTSTDKGGFGWGALGFFFPLVGLILFLIWREEKPLTAKAIGLGALIGVILEVVFSIVIVLITFLVYTPYYLI